MADEKVVVEFVKIKDIGGREHPDYQARIKIWDFLLASYRGGMGMKWRTGIDMTDFDRNREVNGYFAGLFPWEQESDADYQNRVAETFYRPYAKRIVNAFANYVTKNEPDRENAKGADIEAFIANVDRKRHTMKTFIRSVVVNIKVLGTFNVLVDMPPKSDDVKTRADEIAAGITPYVIPILPQQVVDWQIGSDGKYEWLIYETKRFVSDLTEEKGKEVKKRTYWNKEVFQRYEEGDKGKPWKLIESGKHEVEEVPVIRLIADDVDYTPDTPESWFFDLADMNRGIYNIDSFAMLSKAKQSIPQAILPFSQGQSKKDLRVNSAARAWTETKDERGISRFMELSGISSQDYRDTIADIRMEMFRVAGLHHRALTSGVESALAKQWDHEEMNQFLAACASGADYTEGEIYRLRALWLKQTGDPTTASYPKKYNIVEIAEIMAGILDLQQLGFSSETGRKEVTKKAYDVLLQDVPPEIKAQIEKEVDDSKEPDPMESFNNPPTGGDNSGQES